MRSRITNEGNRRAGTSHKLSTFAVLGEEEELIEKKWQEAERLKEEEERREREREKINIVNQMDWADVADDDDDDDYLRPATDAKSNHNDRSGGNDDADDDDEADDDSSKQPQIFIDIKANPKNAKSKQDAEKEDIDSLLKGLKDAHAGTAVKQTDDGKAGESAGSALSAEDRNKAVAQLRAKIAAAGNRSRKPQTATGEEEEKKKKTKAQKKDAKRLYER